MTYETILRRMIDAVLAQHPEVDTREGSLIYNALAPAAVEMVNMYIGLDTVFNETFADTASRPYLILRAAERGIVPDPATRAIVRGVFNIDVPIGSRFSQEEINFIITEQLGTGEYKLEAETQGEVGNQHLGTLIPIDYIAGLTSAEAMEILIPGEDEEQTEALRQRYFDSLVSQAYGGNVQNYKEKVTSLQGVGGAKVYPVWNGGGTVKLVIIDSQWQSPSTTMIDSVQTTVDPTQNAGEGRGLAPIGHVVTVVGVESVAVDISTVITYQDGWTWDDLEMHAQSAIDEYFSELAKDWAESNSLIIRISQIETRFLGLPGVVDITDTMINGAEENLVLGPDQIPVRGLVNG